MKFSLCIVALLMGAGSAMACEQARKVRIEDVKDGAKASFRVELANTNETREKGLMHRQHLAADAGMWFVFDEPYKVAMWMRNTLIPLDMVFVDEKKTVRHIIHKAKPKDLTVLRSPVAVKYVLEINGGKARETGIDAGDRVHCE